ncbi:MAG TPA: TauD/TfdA family dioxygenase [Casimicrobiaceae bacterium]|nr:TauD/TfdA family dioxygenase [Casimicrobiaceae bacterium]
METLNPHRFSCRPLEGELGADLAGVDVSSPSERDVEAIRVALDARLVVRIRGLAFDDVAFTRLAERFGELEGSPDYTRARTLHMPESPLMTVISNVSENGQVVGELGDGEINWHTDLGFTDRPSGYTFLLAREVPPVGGDTSFANMYNAYERLPDELKAQLTRLRLKHQESHTAQGVPRPGYRDIKTNDPRELPGPSHPIVRTHPRTKRKALYLGRRFGGYIAGLTLADSEALLDRLWAAVARPEDVWTQRWQVGDLVIWDNRCTMHRRDAFIGQGRRRMHRLTTIGERPA